MISLVRSVFLRSSCSIRVIKLSIVLLNSSLKLLVPDLVLGACLMVGMLIVCATGSPTSIVSYNHLGNNDGMNFSAPQTFRSKEISKSNVVDDMVASNAILFEPREHPVHVVVIKYVPYVGDSKRAMDEYTSEIFMGGKNTIAPLVPPGTPVVNALSKQRVMLENILRACVGLAPENNMIMEYK
ncbi:unnamed protein product [Arabis nemorensis]|uniref:inositol-3-phosphate synthase n=1 Tax=Arabis nemorensis TaxID=586526 RepID=A0A565C497_9BRAS|nr:unnamed protein product [Arabis nemorensis]